MPPILHIEETASTNSYLKQLLATARLEEGTIISTKHQTAGRGQRGNRWESEEGKNLTFSMLLYPTFIDISEQFILSQIVSLAIIDTLNEHQKGFTIKWPNDIYWQEKKICGILIENSLSEKGIENTIIGIGLNINQEVFLSDAPNPISLRQITNKEHNTEDILEKIQSKILEYYYAIQNNRRPPLVKKYKESLFRKEGYHWYNDGVANFEAKIKDILPDGHLILKTKESVEIKFAFKEIKYIL